MNLLNHLKIEELRIAVLNDLKDFIPDEYLFPDGDPISVSGDDMNIDTKERELYLLIEKDKDKFPLKYSPRSIAALNVYMAIATYRISSSTLSTLSKLPSLEEQSQKGQEYSDGYKSSINYSYDYLISSCNNLLMLFDSWRNHLSESEVKAFPIDCLNWRKEFDELQDFKDKFGFYPERTFKAQSDTCSEDEKTTVQMLASQQETPPGKLPRTAIGKLVIKVAWEIECKFKRFATASEVIKELQNRVDEEDFLVENSTHGVKWTTTKLKVKNYDIETCGKSLNTWHKSRA